MSNPINDMIVDLNRQVGIIVKQLRDRGVEVDPRDISFEKEGETLRVRMAVIPTMPTMRIKINVTPERKEDKLYKDLELVWELLDDRR